MAIYFLAIGSGLGDIIVSLPILQHLVETGEPTYLVARSPRQENLAQLIPGLAGTLTEPEFTGMSLPTSDRYYNFRSHPIQTDYIWGSLEFEHAYPGIRINDMLQIICRDYGINASFDDLLPLTYSASSKASEKIILIPGTVTNTKLWPLNHWLALVSDFKKRGLKVLMLGEPALNPIVQELINNGVPWLETETIMDAIAAISSAAAIISVDTGLMHLAVHQGKPTIALFNSDAMYFRPYSNCYPIYATPCHIKCLQAFQNNPAPKEIYETWAWYDSKYNNCKVGEQERCMTAISPQSVLDQWENLVKQSKIV